MKIGIIADIHSNIYGLGSVLEGLKAVDVILCAGDIVGYYTFVNEVFEEIKKRNIQCILGNHDAYLLKKISVPENPIIKKSLEYTKKVITEENLNYLKEIGKSSLDIEMDNLKIKMYHGSPWDEFEGYVYPDFQKLDEFKKINADLIILGHTHWPMIRRLGGKVIINPGSCGQPRDYDRRASFAIFDTKTKEILIKRVNYETDKVCEAAKIKGLTKESIKILTRTK